MSKNLQIIFGGILIFLTTWAQAQPKINSPYSRFGIGEIVDQNFVTLGSMGGLAASYHNIYNINASNPASLGYLRNTAFEIGVSAKSSTLKSGNTSDKIFTGNIKYMSLGFPMRNSINEQLDRKSTDIGWGMNLALLPYSEVGYTIQSFELIDNVGQIERIYEGNGGTYKFLFGNGFRYKESSFGLNIGYLFGKMSYNREVRFTDQFDAFADILDDDISVTGFIWNAGFMHDFIIEPKNAGPRSRNVLTVGVYGNSSQGFKSQTDRLYRRSFRTTSFGVSDTLRSSSALEGTGRLPAEIGFGARYISHDNWSVGFDYFSRIWSGYENEAKPESLNDASKLSFGASYTPDYSDINNFLNRVDYRLGFFVKSDPRSINSEQIKGWGITLGAGMPFIFNRKISFVNVGLEYGNRGMNTLIKENYFKFALGFTLNDNEWFYKRKYN